MAKPQLTITQKASSLALLGAITATALVISGVEHVCHTLDHRLKSQLQPKTKAPENTR